jgi:hypothetical protein
MPQALVGAFAIHSDDLLLKVTHIVNMKAKTGVSDCGRCLRNLPGVCRRVSIYRQQPEFNNHHPGPS